MYLLRHGQSEFNLHFTRTRKDPGINDPSLTPEGHAQARAAGEKLAGANITRILVSPYTRALQTATEVATLLAAPIEIDVMARERFAFACDIGTPRTMLAESWPTHDFTALEEVWWPALFEPEEDVIARAGQFRLAMQSLPDTSQTLLVSHWGFLLALTGQSLANGEVIHWNPTSPQPTSLVWG